MRISDGSSVVCSADLISAATQQHGRSVITRVRTLDMGEVGNLQILARQRIFARVAGGRRTVGVGFEEGVADIIPFALGGNNKLGRAAEADVSVQIVILVTGDRKSTRLNSSH